jgi:hypothetical protein
MFHASPNGRTRAERRRRNFAAAVAALLLAAVPAIFPLAAAAEEVGSKQQKEATAKLFDAVYANNFANVQASLAAGADLETRDRWGATPIDVAVDRGYFEIAHFLLSVRNMRLDERDQQAKAGPSKDAAAADAEAKQPAKRKPRPAAKPRPPSPVGAAAAPGPSLFSLPAALVGASKSAPVEAAAPPTAPQASAAAPPAEKKKSSTAAASRARPEKAKKPASAAVARRPTAPATDSAGDVPPPTPLPAGQPNPFDPKRPVPGALVPVDGSAEETTAAAAR